MPGSPLQAMEAAHSSTGDSVLAHRPVLQNASGFG